MARINKAKHDKPFRDLVMATCAVEPVIFINDWCWTYDPREKYLVQPFLLWPRQAEWVRFVQEHERERIEGVCEKSRDVGMSWLNAAIFVHHWLFVPDWTGTFVADKEASLDGKGNRRTLLEKCRFIIGMLPPFMRPPGFRLKLHSRHLGIRNPANGATIAGETGDNAGRGGRSSLVIIDEAAHIPRADRLDAAISANADTVLWCSSVNGNGNLFFRKAKGGQFKVFRFHYSDDPRKDAAWVAERKARTDPVVWAQEREIDYGAAIRDLIIPDKWVIGSRELRRRLIGPAAHGFVRAEIADQLRGELTERYALGIGGATAGLDIGAGKAESVLVTRCGPLVNPLVAWLNPDSIDTAEKALGEAIRRKAKELYFDAPGVGQGVLSTFKRMESAGVYIEGVYTGLKASKREWPDGKMSEERFNSRKTELWWLAREAIRRAYELLQWLDGKEDGVVWPLAETLLLPDDDTLARQLATPIHHYDDRGRICIETKDQLSARGIVSPDRADALVLSLSVPGVPIVYVGR